MAKIKRIDPIVRRGGKPTRRPNIFQRGLKSVIGFIRPVKPDLSTTISNTEESGTTTSDPEENNVTTTNNTGENSSGTDPGTNSTNPVNTDDMEPFIGEIRMFGGNFAPRGWALCDGQTLDISSHQALYSVISTFYGGDGRTNFKLPDLRGRVPIHMGQGQGLSSYPMGSAGGSETVNLTVHDLPEHSHDVRFSQDNADSPNPQNNYFASGDHNHYAPDNPGGNMNNGMISKTGEGHPHYNIQPYLTINFIIALEGIFPPRT